MGSRPRNEPCGDSIPSLAGSYDTNGEEMVSPQRIRVLEVEHAILAIFRLSVRVALSRVEHALLPTLPGHVFSVLAWLAWWQW